MKKRIFQAIAGLFLIIGAALVAVGRLGHPSEGSSGMISVSAFGGFIILIGALVFIWTVSQK